MSRWRNVSILKRIRNEWVHEMKSPSKDKTLGIMHTMEVLLNQIKDVQLLLSSLGGHRGSVPQWNIAYLEEHLGNK